MQNQITNWLQHNIGLSQEVLGNILITVFSLVILTLVYRLITGIIRRRVEDLRTQYAWQKATSYVVFVIGLLWFAQIWLGGFTNFTTYLGLITAGLAIALKDLITDFAGWLYILWARPLTVGDRVEISKLAGDVIDLGVFQFTLLEIGNWVDADQSTGRVIHVPNGRIFSDPIANYGAGFQYIWNEIPITITVDSDWQRARDLLQAIVDKHAAHITADAEERLRLATRRYMIYYHNLTPAVYVAIRSNGIQLTMRYLVEPRQRRNTTNEIFADVLKDFAAEEKIKLVHSP